MPGVPEFEFAHRWADISAAGISACLDALEERDRALENHLRSFGSSCSVNFEYIYRWDEIHDKDLDSQIQMLEFRNIDLEDVIRAAGGCRLEFPYRWVQFLPGLIEGDPDAIAMAEENDRYIESRFSKCSCGSTEFHTLTLGNNSCDSTTSLGYAFLEDAYIEQIRFVGTTNGGSWRVNLDMGPSSTSFLLPSLEGPFDFTVSCHLDYTTSDTLLVTMTDDFDPTQNVVIVESFSEIGTLISDTPPADYDEIGSEYQVSINQTELFNPADYEPTIIATGSTTITGDGVSFPHLPYGVSLGAVGSPSPEVVFTHNAQATAGPSTLTFYDIDNVTLVYSIVGTGPTSGQLIRLRMTTHNSYLGLEQVEEAVVLGPATSVDFNMTLDTSMQPFVGPSSSLLPSDDSYTKITATSAAITPCITMIEFKQAGPGINDSFDWIIV